MAKKSQKEALSALLDALADALHKAITEGVKMIDKEGEVHIVPCPPAYLKEARELLKDNNIQALDVPGSPLHKITHGLPFGQEELEAAGKGDMAH
jgi:hypothetical protein